ncbi:MAG: hypothetical protein Kow0063_42400 [Anaerolineae bacterium]
MSLRKPSASWGAFILFYIAMLIVITLLDWLNGLLVWPYWGVQLGLMSLGVAIFAFIGWRMPNLTAEQSVLLAFTVGVLTIIPAILMSLGQSRDFWPQYFLIAMGMATGSFLGFVFVRLAGRLASQDDTPQEE